MLEVFSINIEPFIFHMPSKKLATVSHSQPNINRQKEREKERKREREREREKES